MRLVVLSAILTSARLAAADTGECRSVDVDFTPSADLQIVAWIEDAAGHYVDTAFITQATGLRGLGNRAGIMGLKSGPMWPYGAREDVLPIWAHRHGLTFPAVVWQAERGCDIQTAFSESSPEAYYTRPMSPMESQWDAGTAASPVFTDKGMFAERASLYPPRADLVRNANIDSPDVSAYAQLNPFDAVSQATPPGDAPYRFTWLAPSTLANGDYVLHVEVSKEFDFNATYTQSAFPTTQCTYMNYGVSYRGQPSVTYDVPFTLTDVSSSARADSYAGYSDIDGVVHAPDATITTDTPGSGASRLRTAIAPDSSTYRVRVTTHPEQDAIAPDAASDIQVTALEPTHAELSFVAPGDDGSLGTVAGYDIRYTVGDSLDEQSFDGATPYPSLVFRVAGGQVQTLAFDDLVPYTPYVVGIRAYDNCKHYGPLVIARFETPTAEVSACGCHTADPGIVLALLAFRRRRSRSQ
jgi:hypothetical protein